MTRSRVVATFAFALGLASGLYAQDVSIDFDKGADFGAIESCAVRIATGWGNPIGEKRVLGEFENAFAEKGWAKEAEDEADALVLLHGATEQRRDLDTFYSGYGGYRFRRGFGTVTATTTVREYTVGTLVVDVFDAKTKELIWRGTAEGELKDDPEKREKQVARTADKLLKEFPPKPKAE